MLERLVRRGSHCPFRRWRIMDVGGLGRIRWGIVSVADREGMPVDHIRWACTPGSGRTSSSYREPSGGEW